MTIDAISSAEFRAKFVDKKPQIRLPKKREPNKTEAAWMELCKRHYYKGCKVLFEPFTFLLPSGTRYTPDVVIVRPNDDGPIARIYEVKGAHIHNSASIRAFKEARAAFSFWRFGFAQLVKGEWRVVYD